MLRRDIDYEDLIQRCGTVLEVVRLVAQSAFLIVSFF